MSLPPPFTLQSPPMGCFNTGGYYPISYYSTSDGNFLILAPRYSNFNPSHWRTINIRTGSEDPKIINGVYTTEDIYNGSTTPIITLYPSPEDASFEDFHKDFHFFSKPDGSLYLAYQSFEKRRLLPPSQGFFDLYKNFYLEFAKIVDVTYETDVFYPPAFLPPYPSVPPNGSSPFTKLAIDGWIPFHFGLAAIKGKALDDFREYLSLIVCRSYKSKDELLFVSIKGKDNLTPCAEIYDGPAYFLHGSGSPSGYYYKEGVDYPFPGYQGFRPLSTSSGVVFDIPGQNGVYSIENCVFDHMNQDLEFYERALEYVTYSTSPVPSHLNLDASVANYSHVPPLAWLPAFSKNHAIDLSKVPHFFPSFWFRNHQGSLVICSFSSIQLDSVKVLGVDISSQEFEEFHVPVDSITNSIYLNGFKIPLPSNSHNFHRNQKGRVFVTETGLRYVRYTSGYSYYNPVSMIEYRNGESSPEFYGAVDDVFITWTSKYLDYSKDFFKYSPEHDYIPNLELSVTTSPPSSSPSIELPIIDDYEPFRFLWDEASLSIDYIVYRYYGSDAGMPLYRYVGPDGILVDEKSITWATYNPAIFKRKEYNTPKQGLKYYKCPDNNIFAVDKSGNIVADFAGFFDRMLAWALNLTFVIPPPSDILLEKYFSEFRKSIDDFHSDLPPQMRVIQVSSSFSPFASLVASRSGGIFFEVEFKLIPLTFFSKKYSSLYQHTVQPPGVPLIVAAYDISRSPSTNVYCAAYESMKSYRKQTYGWSRSYLDLQDESIAFVTHISDDFYEYNFRNISGKLSRYEGQPRAPFDLSYLTPLAYYTKKNSHIVIVFTSILSVNHKGTHYYDMETMKFSQSMKGIEPDYALNEYHEDTDYSFLQDGPLKKKYYTTPSPLDASTIVDGYMRVFSSTPLNPLLSHSSPIDTTFVPWKSTPAPILNVERNEGIIFLSNNNRKPIYFSELAPFFDFSTDHLPAVHLDSHKYGQETILGLSGGHDYRSSQYIWGHSSQVERFVLPFMVDDDLGEEKIPLIPFHFYRTPDSNVIFVCRTRKEAGPRYFFNITANKVSSDATEWPRSGGEGEWDPSVEYVNAYALGFEPFIKDSSDPSHPAHNEAPDVYYRNYSFHQSGHQVYLRNDPIFLKYPFPLFEGAIFYHFNLSYVNDPLRNTSFHSFQNQYLHFNPPIDPDFLTGAACKYLHDEHLYRVFIDRRTFSPVMLTYNPHTDTYHHYTITRSVRRLKLEEVLKLEVDQNDTIPHRIISNLTATEPTEVNPFKWSRMPIYRSFYIDTIESYYSRRVKGLVPDFSVEDSPFVLRQWQPTKAIPDPSPPPPPTTYSQVVGLYPPLSPYHQALSNSIVLPHEVDPTASLPPAPTYEDYEARNYFDIGLLWGMRLVYPHSSLNDPLGLPVDLVEVGDEDDALVKDNILVLQIGQKFASLLTSMSVFEPRPDLVDLNEYHPFHFYSSTVPRPTLVLVCAHKDNWSLPPEGQRFLFADLIDGVTSSFPINYPSNPQVYEYKIGQTYPFAGAVGILGVPKPRLSPSDPIGPFSLQWSRYDDIPFYPDDKNEDPLYEFAVYNINTGGVYNPIIVVEDNTVDSGQSGFFLDEYFAFLAFDILAGRIQHYPYSVGKNLFAITFGAPYFNFEVPNMLSGGILPWNYDNQVYQIPHMVEDEFFYVDKFTFSMTPSLVPYSMFTLSNTADPFYVFGLQDMGKLTDVILVCIDLFAVASFRETYGTTPANLIPSCLVYINLSQGVRLDFEVNRGGNSVGMGLNVGFLKALTDTEALETDRHMPHQWMGLVYYIDSIKSTPDRPVFYARSIADNFVSRYEETDEICVQHPVDRYLFSRIKHIFDYSDFTDTSVTTSVLPVHEGNDSSILYSACKCNDCFLYSPPNVAVGTIGVAPIISVPPIDSFKVTMKFQNSIDIFNMLSFNSPWINYTNSILDESNPLHIETNDPEQLKPTFYSKAYIPA